MKTSRVLPFCLLAALVFGWIFPLALSAQQQASGPEEIEWTWEVRPKHPDPQLPNVLLLGDSISRNYFPRVTEKLAGVANVYLMASSTTVGDSRLPHQIAEFAAVEGGVRFAVVHFNNGMHGWSYTETQYKDAFPGFVDAVRGLLDKGGVLIWATTTPVKADQGDGATNARIDARNAIAASALRSANVVVDDQHALMMQHQDLHSDNVHFGDAGATIQGDQVAKMIQAQLGGTRRTTP